MNADKQPSQHLRPLFLPTVLFICMSFQCMKVTASPLDRERAGAFLQGLLDHPDSMEAFICDDDMKIAGRLGIDYPEAPCKPLIAWDLSAQMRDRLRRNGVDGRFAVETLDSGHSRLVLFPQDSLLTRSWIFRDGEVISSILYRIRDWKVFDSTHFRFFISDSSLFHIANIEALESFLAVQANLLGMSDTDMERLSNEKIYYCFCRNEDEIRELTGHAARGMYVVSHDIIVSTYSAHYHELAHLLINYRLKHPHLNTHPFFLEGFAVAVGGRGGKSPEVLHQLGLSLHRAGWVSLGELLDANAFYQMNASISYPACAPYNRFLLDHLGISNYLALYVQYGGGGQSVSHMRIQMTNLPSDIEWRNYLARQPHEGGIIPGNAGNEMAHELVAFQPLPESRYLGFSVPEITLATAGTISEGYRSIVFEQLIDNRSYAGERFLIKASAEEVGVYDLYTNTMIAHYSSALSESKKAIPSTDGRYVFQIDRSVFPGELADIQCRFIKD